MAKSACGSSRFCCYYKTGGSLNAYRIRVRTERCSAYETFVNLDTSLPVSKWPKPGVEIEWASRAAGANVQTAGRLPGFGELRVLTG